MSQNLKDLRVTVDLDEPDIQALYEIEGFDAFRSRRLIFLTGLRVLLQLGRAKRLGYRPKMNHPSDTKEISFSWDEIPQLRLVNHVRLLNTSGVKEDTLRNLISRARESRDLDLERTIASICQAAWDPIGPKGVEDGIIADLIVITVGIQNTELTKLVRDFLTQITTTFKSFDEMVSEAKKGYRPHFDTRYREQRFINQEYQREVGQKDADLT
jgi:hypothetical protein